MDGFVLQGDGTTARFKSVVYDSGGSMLIFELNSQTNTPHPSVLLQICMSNAQISLSCTEFLVETRLKRRYLMTWFGGSTRAILFVSHLQSQGWVWTPDIFFQCTHRKDN